MITPFSVNLAHAKELMLTGDTVDAEEAARIGWVSRVVPHDRLMDECEKVAKKICLVPQIGVKLTKDSVNRAMEEMVFKKTHQAQPGADDSVCQQHQPRTKRVQRHQQGRRTPGGPELAGRPV